MQREENFRRIRERRFSIVWMDKRGRDSKISREGWRENRWRRVTQFRLGNEMRERRYWEGEEKRLCKLCVKGSLKHGST